MNTRVAQQIIMGYIRAIQKARSNAIEACDESRSVAAGLDSVLFSEGTDRLLEALADAADHPSPTDAMNLSRMMQSTQDGSPGLADHGSGSDRPGDSTSSTARSTPYGR